MAIEELDLEFEKETDAASGDAIDAGDISFSANAHKAGMAKSKPIPRQKPAAHTENVTPINQARTKPATSSGETSSELLKLREEIEQLKSRMDESKKETDIKLAVSEAEKEYLIDYISNAKLLNHQMGQILSRIHKKVPALSAEVGAAKKYLQDFLISAKPKKKD